MSVLPGEVHLADVFEGGLRPVIIVSREVLNRGSLFLCVPVTSSRVARATAVCELRLSAGGNRRTPR